MPSVMEKNFKVPQEIAIKEFNNNNKPLLTKTGNF